MAWDMEKRPGGYRDEVVISARSNGGVNMLYLGKYGLNIS